MQQVLAIRFMFREGSEDPFQVSNGVSGSNPLFLAHRNPLHRRLAY